jgi:hypothetical protein
MSEKRWKGDLLPRAQLTSCMLLVFRLKEGKPAFWEVIERVCNVFCNPQRPK